MCMNSMIEVRDVSVRFRMANDKINSLKEYMIQKLRGQLKYNEFKALSQVSLEKRGNHRVFGNRAIYRHAAAQLLIRHDCEAGVFNRNGH